MEIQTVEELPTVQYAAFTQAMDGATFEYAGLASDLKVAQDLADVEGEHWRANGFVFQFEDGEKVPSWMPANTSRQPVYQSPIIYLHP